MLKVNVGLPVWRKSYPVILLVTRVLHGVRLSWLGSQGHLGKSVEFGLALLVASTSQCVRFAQRNFLVLAQNPGSAAAFTGDGDPQSAEMEERD